MSKDSIKKYIETTETLLDDLEQFINKIDDLNRYNEPITQEKWEHLMFYYVKPLKKQYAETINVLCDII